MASWFQKKNTIINITKLKYRPFRVALWRYAFCCLSVLPSSVATLCAQDYMLAAVEKPKNLAATPSPQIKKEELKNFILKGSEALLQQHSITEYNIHGKVVQYTEYGIDSTGAQVLKVKKIQKYDRNGRRIGTMLYNNNHALVWSEEYKLDENGRKVRIIQTHYEEAAPRVLYINYTYDNRGYISSIITQNSDNESLGEYRRQYNMTGELSSINAWSYVWSNEENKMVKRSVRTDHKYDLRGNLLRSETEIVEGKNKWRDVRGFENNFVVEWSQFKNNELVSQFKHSKRGNLPTPEEEDYELPPPIPYHAPAFEYDDDKRDPLQSIEHTPVRTVTLKSNAQGHPVKEVVREQQQISTVTYYYYDEAERLIRRKKTNKQEDWTDETIFEYDQYQNPTKELTYRNGQLLNERSFSYEYYN